MRRIPLTDLPFWPRYLSCDEAARYLGGSADVFDDEVRSGECPPARPRGARGGRLTWDRVALDHAADRASGLIAADEGRATADAAADKAAADAWSARIRDIAKRMKRDG